MHPMGWDAFGLPAEQHAKKTGTPPRITTEKNTATFRRQLQMLGFSYDWDRELATTDPDYFRWTQWIFLQLFDTWFDAEQQRGRPISELPIPARRRRRGRRRRAPLSGRASAGLPVRGAGQLVPGAGDGAGQRGSDRRRQRAGRPSGGARCRYGSGCCGSRPMPIGWKKTWIASTGPQSIKTLQRNWIGRSTGAEVDFFIGHARSEQRRPARRPPSSRPGAMPARLRGFPRRPGRLTRSAFTRPAPTRCMAPPTWCSRPSTRWSSG